MITGSPGTATAVADENDLCAAAALGRKLRPRLARTQDQDQPYGYPWDIRHDMDWWYHFGIDGLSGDEFDDLDNWDGFSPGSYISYAEAMAFVGDEDPHRPYGFVDSHYVEGDDDLRYYESLESDLDRAS